MDLYAIHKLYQQPAGDNNYGTGTISSTSTSDKSLWDSHFADRDEFARFLNMMLSKTPLVDRPSLRAYDVNYDDTSSSEDPSTTSGLPQGGSRASSTDFVSSLLAPFNQGSGRITSFNASGSLHPSSSGSAKLPTLADQFTWGAVVCAGVFIVVFVCVLAAWWVHKRQQERVRSRTSVRTESRRTAVPPANGPYCIDNDPRLATGAIQRPPSYFEVIGFFDPPPSYNDVLRVAGSRRNSHQSEPSATAYDNVAITIDELPPPFVEGDYAIKSGGHHEELQSSAITTDGDDPVTVILANSDNNGNAGEETSHH